MMHWWRKLRGLRLLPERHWTNPSLLIWECTRCHMQGQISFQFHHIQVLLGTRTCNCHHLVTPNPPCRLISCNKQILTKCQIYCKTTSLVVCRDSILVAKEHPWWSLKAPQYLQMRVAPHFEFFDQNLLDLLTSPWHYSLLFKLSIVLTSSYLMKVLCFIKLFLSD